MWWETILPYVERGLVSCERHPGWPDLAIFNYTPRCEFGRHWDNVTRVCRGLVVDLGRDRVVARPFPKFFGLWELPGLGVSLPPGEPEVTVKLDGVLGISYRTPDGELHWATRGSFVSEQAVVAEEMWRGRPQPPPELTLLCEIIHPRTRVVVPYDFVDLVLIGAVETETGRDLGWEELAVLAREVGLRVVERVPLGLDQAVARAEAMRADSGEGFVLRWRGGFRVKVKAREYVEAHRVLVGLESRRNLAEAWRRGELGALPGRLPEAARFAAQAGELDALWREALGTCEAFFEERRNLPPAEYAAQVRERLPGWLHPVAFAVKESRSRAEAVARDVVARKWAASCAGEPAGRGGEDSTSPGGSGKLGVAG